MKEIGTYWKDQFSTNIYKIANTMELSNGLNFKIIYARYDEQRNWYHFSQLEHDIQCTEDEYLMESIT